MPVLFTRTDYTLGIRCPRLLWSYRHGRDAGDGVSEWHLGQLNNRIAVEKYTQNLKKCRRIDDGDIYTAVAKTADALADGGVDSICGAAFIVKNLSVRCDLLRRNSQSSYTLSVVRATAHIRQIACHDAAYQIFVLAACGIKVNCVEFVRINTAYTPEGKAPLFLTERITSRVMSQVHGVAGRLEKMLKTLASESLPDKDIHNGCFNPFECECRQSCFENLPRHNVFDVGGLRRQTKFDLYRAGAVSLEDVAESGDVPENIRAQVRAAIDGGEMKVRRRELREFLSTLTYPMCFLDFEAVQLPFPEYEGVHPFESVAFQYSLHVLKSPDSAPIHTGCIVPTGKDPRPVIAKRLANEIPKGACVVAYSMQLEKQVVSALAKRYPKYSARLCEICRNMKDIMVPFLKGLCYAPGMNGSYSLKKVLAALYPGDAELDYRQLSGVHNGQEAQVAYSLAAAGDPKADEYISELDTYCALDTFALYKIYQKLCAAAGLPAPSEDGAKSGAVCSADGAKSAEEAEIGTATGGKTGIGGKKDKKRFPFPFFLFSSHRRKK